MYGYSNHRQSHSDLQAIDAIIIPGFQVWNPKTNHADKQLGANVGLEELETKSKVCI